MNQRDWKDHHQFDSRVAVAVVAVAVAVVAVAVAVAVAAAAAAAAAVEDSWSARYSQREIA